MLGIYGGGDVGQEVGIGPRRLGWNAGQLQPGGTVAPPPATVTRRTPTDQISLSGGVAAAPITPEVKATLKQGADAITQRLKAEHAAMGRTLDGLMQNVGTMSVQDLQGKIYSLQRHQDSLNQWGHLYDMSHRVTKDPKLGEQQAKVLAPVMQAFTQGKPTPQQLEQLTFKLTQGVDQIGRAPRKDGELEEGALRYATRVGDLKATLGQALVQRREASPEDAARLDETVQNTRHEMEVADRFVKLTQDLNRNPRATDADRKLLAAYLQQAETTGRPRESLVKAEDLVRNVGRQTQTDRKLYERTHQLGSLIETREQELLQLGQAAQKASGKELETIQQQARQMRDEIGGLLKLKSEVDHVAERHKPDPALTQDALRKLDEAIRTPVTMPLAQAQQLEALEHEERSGNPTTARWRELQILKQSLAPDAPQQIKDIAKEIRENQNKQPDPRRSAVLNLMAHGFAPGASPEARSIAERLSKGDQTDPRELEEMALLMIAEQPQATEQMRQIAKELRRAPHTAQGLREKALLMSGARADATYKMKAIAAQVASGEVNSQSLDALTMAMEAARAEAGLPPLL